MRNTDDADDDVDRQDDDIPDLVARGVKLLIVNLARPDTHIPFMTGDRTSDLFSRSR